MQIDSSQGKTWTIRYFQLTWHGIKCAAHPEANVEEQITFSKDQLIIVNSQGGNDNSHNNLAENDHSITTFSIKHGMRMWFLRSETAEERDEWIENIRYGKSFCHL